MYTALTARPGWSWAPLSSGHRAIWAMRGMITATALQWVIDGDAVSATIGLSCLGLSMLPAMLVRNAALRMQTALTASGLLLAHVCLGMDAGLYELSSVYDKAAHGLGSGAIAATLHVAIRQHCTRHGIGLSTKLQAVAALGAVISIGAGWEVFEFAVDQTGLVSAQKGLTDTMLDLIANAAGAIAVLTALAIAQTRKTQNDFPQIQE